MPSRGPVNDLHRAAFYGSTERTLAVLSRGGIDIDQGTQGRFGGFTPLMMAAQFGHTRVANALLENGASVNLKDDQGYTALHQSAQKGHLATTKLLVKAGADLEAKTCTSMGGGYSPLHRAVQEGCLEVVNALIETGADPNTRSVDGFTPLMWAAQEGDMGVLKVLLHAKANPLLLDGSFVALDVAAGKGHLDIVQELIQEHGIEGCGGASGGVAALARAAQYEHVDIMELLTNAGVVDTGGALLAAACCGMEFSVKFLLQQWKRNASSRENGTGYLDVRRRSSGRTPLLNSMLACSPRITRMLVDAGADTSTAIHLSIGEKVYFDGTPLAYTELCLANKNAGGEDATESQLQSMEAIRRLLMRVEACHAVSWLWASNAHAVPRAASESAGAASAATSTPLVSMLPILRRRAGRPRVLLAALSRWVW